MRTVCIVFLATLALACSDEAPTPDPVHDAASPVAIHVDSVAPLPRISTWNDAAGPVLLVAGERPEDAIVVLPDAQGYVSADSLDASEYVGERVMLLDRTGATASGTLDEDQGDGPEPTCSSWPILTLPPGTPRWTVGFIGNGVTAYPLDSVQAMARRDSSSLVAQVARLASEARINTRGPHAESFHGLPFVVQEARRFRHDTLDVLVAQVVRRVNQEASPLEEHTLLVAERTAGSDAWKAARIEWTVGREESVGRQQLLGAVSMRGEPALVFTHDSGSEMRYAIHWRGGGAWAKRWVSGISRC